MKRYEIQGSGENWTLSEVQDMPDNTRRRLPLMFGSWLICAWALRLLHPKAQLFVTQDLLVSNSIDRFLARNKESRHQ